MSLDTVGAALYLRWPEALPITVLSAAEGLRIIDKELPNVIFLSPGLIDMTSYELLIEARRLTQAPILVLADSYDEMEMVSVLRTGADDYVRLPCDPRELMLRVWSLMRRSFMDEQSVQPPLIIGDMTINPSSKDILIDTRRILLTDKEFSLLYELVLNRERVVPKSRLEKTLWGSRLAKPWHLSKIIQTLRKKIGDDSRSPIWISSVRGRGYLFHSCD